MQKNKHWIIKVLLVILVIGSIIFKIGKNFYEGKDLEEVHLTEEGSNYSLKIAYPRVTNKKINRKIEKYVNEQKESFLKTIKEQKNKGFQLILNYDRYSYKNIDFIHLVFYIYMGNNHYERIDKMFNYEQKSGKEVDISYFLAGSLDDLRNLSRVFLRMYFKENNLEMDDKWLNKGLEAKESNYSIFKFLKRGLEITFVPYQVAKEEIKIVIPYDKLKNVIKEEFLNYDDNDLVAIAKIPDERDLTKFLDKKLIAFTFDDGPGGRTTKKLLDNLDKYEARVTFFVLGSRVNNYTDNLKRAYEMGNTIGNHTFNHRNLYTLKNEEGLKEIVDTNQLLESILGSKINFIRPPYGNIDDKMKKNSNMYTILWSIDPEDWKYKNANKIAKKIVKHAHDGAIVLLHDIYMSSIDGALKAMEILKDEGYAFVSIEEMIKLKGVNLDIFKTYYSF